LISVPFLLKEDGGSLGDSFAIAREADRLGSAPPLVPTDLVDEIKVWNERSERIMRAGRARILARTETSKEIQIESLPPHLPRGIRGLLAPTVRIGTAYLRKKYAVREVPDEELEADLAALRAAIAGESAKPLLGEPTLADIAMATALQAVRPHRSEPVGLLPAQREAWARPELAARWEDVLEWRDAVVERSRSLFLANNAGAVRR
jgi:glutathione S-transferase